ncbi:glycosyltransferase family 39 protein [Acidiferrimicrobium sp. IK]|uniref:ArnT family glycosyltransferase n=1 Tax=Acidiferrimicrobium sp. IK TaxID=2871700 RepID=UPI0021CB3CE7|nr:glycosyltransferase family 39 protein [Acidiferrimicrobium sp. IK]MCU4183503.1 glycosyltransferase family 39 protein [Acidiferrimicrobium sp. IK]
MADEVLEAPPTSAADPEAPARRWPGVVAVVLCAVFVALGVWQAWSDAPTYDEPTYVAAGVLALTAHDVTFEDEHPALGKALAALPVLLAHPVIPPGYRHMDQHPYAVAFAQAQLRAGKLRLVMLLARLVPLAEAAAVGLLLFRLGRTLFGPLAGLLAAVVWFADPLTLGLAHLDGVDVPMTLATMLLGWALLLAVRAPSRRRLLVLGAACGGVILANADGLGLAGVALLVVVAAGWRKQRWNAAGRVLPVAVAGWLSLSAGYAVFDPASVLPYVVVPEPFVQGVGYLLTHDTRPAVGYLLGWSWTGGRWWYWPLSLAVKVPWALLALVLAGPFAYPRLPRRLRREVLAAFGVPAVALAIALLQVKRDIGVRYALPIVALCALLASPIAEVPSALRSRAVKDGRPARRRGPAAVAAGGLMAAAAAVAVVETVGSAPHSLAWVNPGLGPSYQVASNSSQDWGQDFYSLRRWATPRKAFVAYSGLALTVGDIPGARPLLVRRAGRLVAVDPRTVTGWVAVSSSVLTAGGYSQLGWLRAYCPVGQLDGTILLYDFLAAPTGVAAPVEPAGLCRSGSDGSVAASR